MIQINRTIISLLLFASIFVSSLLYSSDFKRENRITPLVECVYRAMPSVVYLSTERLIPVEDETNMPFANMEPEKYQAEYSLGSGCIIDEDGLILTNAHVVQRTARIQVTLNNGKRYWAEIVAMDSYNDLALLRILNLEHKLRPIDMGEPGDLLLGESVVIVGNPYGLGGTIVVGVLSAFNRRVSYNEFVVFDDLLQTDAMVNPGHSGAPLLNSNGELIGLSMANLIDAPGISFAIPQQRLGDLLGQWLIPERFGDLSLGIVPMVRRDESGELVFYLHNVLPNSPAEAAGLRPGMVIDYIDGERLDSDIMQISGKLWKAQAGDKFKLQSGIQTYNLVAEDMSLDDWRRQVRLKLGIELRELNSVLLKTMDYPEVSGLIVSKPPTGNSDIKRGDILIRINDTAINSGNDLSRALANVRFGDSVNAVFLEFGSEKTPAGFRRKNITLSVNKIR